MHGFFVCERVWKKQDAHLDSLVLISHAIRESSRRQTTLGPGKAIFHTQLHQDRWVLREKTKLVFMDQHVISSLRSSRSTENHKQTETAYMGQTWKIRRRAQIGEKKQLSLSAVVFRRREQISTRCKSMQPHLQWLAVLISFRNICQRPSTQQCHNHAAHHVQIPSHNIYKNLALRSLPLWAPRRLQNRNHNHNAMLMMQSRLPESPIRNLKYSEM